MPLMTLKWKKLPTAYRWFVLALLFSVLGLLFTVVYATGVLNFPTLIVEHWLLLRPLTRIDCIFYEWRLFGEVPFSLLLTGILSFICIRIGYRRRVVLYLFLLLLAGVGVEIVGKQLFALPTPSMLLSGMTNLSCPQLNGQSLAVRIGTGLGLWWQIPYPTLTQISWIHDVYHMPLNFHEYALERGYPSGHALRWCFLGLISAWLVWRRMRPCVLRTLITLCMLLLAFAGGFMQLYIGVHFLSDVLVGYTLGTALACLAIGLLLLNNKSFYKL